MLPAVKHTRKAKVKSGCRTCKTRKVKCDEARPACKRCVTTGRVCDGYGIWGGGGRAYHERYVVEPTGALYTHVVSRPRAAPPVLVLHPREQECFEWFKYRTSIKVPTSYAAGFWNTLIFQSSVQEPAILNAVLALGSYHMNGGGTAQSHQIEKTKAGWTAEEKFTLQHYVEAMRHLNPHFARKGKASTRVALIACFLFASFELFRGHFEATRLHLDNGVKILEESRSLFPAIAGGICVRACMDSIDDWIVEAILRIQLQSGILRYTHTYPYRNLLSTTLDLPSSAFQSVHEAWQHLSPLLSEAMALTQEARLYIPSRDSSSTPFPPARMADAQARIQAGLHQWLPQFSAFHKGLQEAAFAEEQRDRRLPFAIHAMATIMANTCLSRGDESAFDRHTADFAQLLHHLTSLRRRDPALSPFTAPASDMSRAIVDMGWIPPLYFTAIKCRVRRVRVQAIRLLESTAHREGLWDSQVAACIARKVMELEEQQQQVEESGVGVAEEDFPLCSPPTLEELALPTPPGSHRLCSVEVLLPGEPLERILLGCRWAWPSERREAMWEYSMATQRWADVTPVREATA
ncbi:hypothetical protein VD0004_g8942 [Verticillium dahliae]|uniref:Zn(2)-C6 fungal-type domain-containing protein n=1 Tax=Verticillium dahliae TaxID=27337 RepID=A0A444RS70_VERDA|nr:hypothetical protein VD0004_g8942 [Verticillium dahliae]PNH65307.1 hypothetical protein VD0001_g8539 [Verticillium dahliae]RXG44042.1 hypothetical protein VDGE_03675 [Verticillium dahliae]